MIVNVTPEDRAHARKLLVWFYRGGIQPPSFPSDRLVFLIAEMVHEAGLCSQSMNIVNMVFSLFVGNPTGKANALKLLREAGETLRRNGEVCNACRDTVASKYRTSVMEAIW
ncbi:MAG: hypothetical protein D6758_08220 [Gammaproteobacteria bacterium]|nr:MAG: hypothetical protein D6758_08220 [Gammaproteobacteria bacterium]